MYPVHPLPRPLPNLVYLPPESTVLYRRLGIVLKRQDGRDGRVFGVFLVPLNDLLWDLTELYILEFTDDKPQKKSTEKSEVN